MEYIKKAIATAESKSEGVRDSVKKILHDIEEGRESAVQELAKKFDNWDGDFVLSEEKKHQLLKKSLNPLSKISVSLTSRFRHLQKRSGTAFRNLK